MTKTTKTETIKTIAIICLIIGIIVLLILVDNNNNIDKEKSKEAVLNAETYDWAINLYNEDEMFFEYFLYNYGSIEAKNIKVRCLLVDESNNVRISVIDYFGNLASNSYEFGEVKTKNTLGNSKELFSALCYVKDCDNCKILYKEIPELVYDLEEVIDNL